MSVAGWCSGSTYSPVVSLGQAVASPGQVFRLSHALTHPRSVVCIRMPKTGCVLFMLFLELMKHNVTAHHTVSQMKDPTWGCSSTNKHTSYTSQKQSCKMCFCLMSAPRTAPSISQRQAASALGNLAGDSSENHFDKQAQLWGLLCLHCFTLFMLYNYLRSVPLCVRNDPTKSWGLVMSFCSQNSVSKSDAWRGDDCSSRCPYTFGALAANNGQRRSVQNLAQPGSSICTCCNSM